MTPFHSIGDLVRDLLGLVPLSMARLLFIAVPAGLLLWVLSLPREVVTPPNGSGRWDANLKVWAAVALGIQIVIYALF